MKLLCRLGLHKWGMPTWFYTGDGPELERRGHVYKVEKACRRCGAMVRATFLNKQV